MSSNTVDPSAEVELSGFYGPGKGRSSADLARVVADYTRPSARQSKPTTARSRVEAKRTKKTRDIPLGPTPERLAKGDIVRSTGGGAVAEGGLEGLRRSFKTPEPTKAEEVLSRLHRKCSLDHDPGMNERMYEAGKKYDATVYLAGMGGIGAQDLLALRGDGNPAHMMPVSAAAADARLRLRKAWTILNPKLARAVHALLIDGHDAASVGRELSTYKTPKECSTAALTALRIALWTLVEARWA